MTAAEHLARSEQILAHLDDPTLELDVRIAAASVQLSIAHLLAAVALELGVPPATTSSGGGTSGAT